ncbi:hypothetical protein BDF21DRAFT_397181 [Thamnidium elegans]|nr:hypothetical protein BDF21DRAFT_397181 [Thamnidium elegans]
MIVSDFGFRNTEEEEPCRGYFGINTTACIYIKAFMLLYVTYIKDVIANKLSAIVDPNMNIQIGYAVTIEKLVLSRLSGTEKENVSEKIEGSRILDSRNDFKVDQDIPVAISIVYRADVSVLSFTVKLAEERVDGGNVTHHAEPMHLSRF